MSRGPRLISATPRFLGPQSGRTLTRASRPFLYPTRTDWGLEAADHHGIPGWAGVEMQPRLHVRVRRTLHDEAVTGERCKLAGRMSSAHSRMNSFPSGSASSVPFGRSPTIEAPSPRRRASSSRRSSRASRTHRSRFRADLTAIGGPPQVIFTPPSGDWIAVSSSWSHTRGQPRTRLQK